jgi:hypothetical protein
MKEHLVPKVGEHRLYDLLSENTSLETKASTARWYAEMMIDLFFSAKRKKELGESKFNNLSLGDKIKIIKPEYSSDLIDALNLIKQFGDIASHYKPERSIDEKNVKKIIEKALSLFDFVLIDLMKDRGIRKTEVTATLFSTFLPSIRIRVLRSITDLSSIKGDSDNDMFLLDKLVLALTKNGESKKAFRILEKLKKEEKIGEYHFDFCAEKIDIIQCKIDDGILPIPENISDCKRNFEDVLGQMSDVEKSGNKELIDVFNTMLDQVEPSQMGDKMPSLMVLM